MFTVRCSPLLRKVKTTLCDLLRTLPWSFMKLFHPVLSGQSQKRYPKECIQSEILAPRLTREIGVPFCGFLVLLIRRI